MIIDSSPGYVRYYWVRDQVCQGHFVIYWRPADANYADYYTKHFPPRVHQTIHPTRIHTPPDQANYFACLDDDESVDEPDANASCTRSIQLHCIDELRSNAASEGVLIPVPDTSPGGPDGGQTATSDSHSSLALGSPQSS